MHKITVTSPLLPPLGELIPYLEDIWNKKWLTNNGYYHQQLEKALCDYLGVPFISLYSNGTLALIAALQALDLEGEVITTPYSFVATSHSIMLANLEPVFVDINPNTFNIDENKIERAITERTSAIMPVHVYGNPCNNDKIQKIADKYNLKIIYDAAHAFNVKKNGHSILNWGDLSMLSFHATKAYSTIEGGAVICNSIEMKRKLDKLKNFGFDSETEISMLGSNAKLNEIQSAFGLATLNHIDNAINLRKRISSYYVEQLDNIEGISLFTPPEDVEFNYSYFPILIDVQKYGLSRDELYFKMQKHNIFARRYFYPLITDFKLYQHMNVKFDNATSVSNSVICLPMHHDLTKDDTLKVVKVIKEK